MPRKKFEDDAETALCIFSELATGPGNENRLQPLSDQFFRGCPSNGLDKLARKPDFESAQL